MDYHFPLNQELEDHRHSTIYFKEIKSDLGVTRTNNTLTDWAKQGVFLLNSIMTVVKDTPLSHKGKGWEIFTDDVIKLLNQRENLLSLFYGEAMLEGKKALITNPNTM